MTSCFKSAKIVLIFNGAQVLVAMTRSERCAQELMNANLQSISFACTGRYVHSDGLYFRHLNTNVNLKISDIGTLKLKEYDRLCNEARRYYTTKEMVQIREYSKTLKNRRIANNCAREDE